MGTGKWDRSYALLICLIFVLVSSFSAIVSTENPSLVVGEFNETLQLTPGVQVEKSPGLKSGTEVVCGRVHIDGLSRFRNLKKFAHLVKVKVSEGNSTLRRLNVEVCFHRNASLGIGMCPQGKWEKVSNGLWAKPMSPFDHKLLDIRMTSSSTQTLEVSIEEEFFAYRIVVLIMGIVLWSVAYTLSQSLVFYYSSAMDIGVILVVLIVLFQGKKLLPTGQKNSLAIVIYSSLSSMDPLLATEAFLSGLLLSSVLCRVTRLKFLHRVYKKLFKLAEVIGRNTEATDLSPYQCSHDEYTYKRPEDSNFLNRRSNYFPLTSCNTSLQGITKTSPSWLSDMDSFPSIFHNTPERRKFSEDLWEKFARDPTKMAVEELVSSLDFRKWAAANAERITVTPRSSSGSASARPSRWFLWS